MTIHVPYIKDRDIEIEAEALISSFQNKHGAITTAATPVEEIIENHLGLAFEIVDLGHPEILGQLDIRTNTLSVNMSLDPDEYPDMQGRYNFTLGHEVGHQILHRRIVEELMASPTLFDNKDEQDDIILCRREDRKEPIEYQADRFASALLLPREKVARAFRSRFKGVSALSASRIVRHLRHNRPALDKLGVNPNYVANDEQLVKYWFKGLADDFGVSMEAMVIRLRTLGLLGEDAYSQQRMEFV